jgi:hypothetical protein
MKITAEGNVLKGKRRVRRARNDLAQGTEQWRRGGLDLAHDPLR